MNRRDFLKNALLLAALAPLTPLTRLAAKEGPDGNKDSDLRTGPGVARRRYRNTAMSLPLLGFGMMRLPRLASGEIDYTAAAKLFDRAMQAGVNYFDTAYFYHKGQSEKCAGDLLSKYPRDSYYLADKMPVQSVRKEADVERIWTEQLQKCRTEYFDFYMLHNLNRNRWNDVERFHIYEFLKKKQEEGKIRKLGFSFHDGPNALEPIAKAHPWDFAQIQLNYLDWTLYHSKEQYEILTELGIPVIVMEPLRGGALASLNAEANAILRKAAPDASVASWAFRYAAGFPNVITVLSGMTQMPHLEDNIRTFTGFTPLSDSERKTLNTAINVCRKLDTIPCTACRYCVPCPAEVDIPGIFGLYNQAKTSGEPEKARQAYRKLSDDERASACVKCGVCLKKCPQKIKIPTELARADKELSKR